MDAPLAGQGVRGARDRRRVRGLVQDGELVARAAGSPGRGGRGGRVTGLTGAAYLVLGRTGQGLLLLGVCSPDLACARWPWWRTTAGGWPMRCARASAGRNRSAIRGWQSSA